MATMPKTQPADDMVYRIKSKEKRDAFFSNAASGGAMPAAERAARQQGKDAAEQRANTKAYDASLTTNYKKGGLVKMTPKATPYKR